ncbi:hypothetical protein SLV14_006651 [Streptomyces sp. Je 1-4]|uniref:hypothetical protein n=1 Tax=Streptomyces explomaris TaxID=2981351 RepID=UPI0021D99C74|nr:hypothetical protein [Streptomyces sp. Je 1-4]UYB43647.1 hypothetical protein SLV14_006651 [Streptomyces sp. Je 1-4]UZQ40045.1 hypothetical protein SLV14N_006651 [Streptomyces sp. Je 1-4] [Streptomyces sp. Je 1-4 4N24]UZQ47462.1 hypothetical protein SLV14NA_006651 [Streptomyces sp. Je 1-4] [Streptomyces sp. Je 1-4 4N24_ara]
MPDRTDVEPRLVGDGAQGRMVFAVALMLRRGGKLGEARRYAAPAARAASRWLDDRGAARSRGGPRGVGAVAGAAIRAAARHLDDDGRGQRERGAGR